MPATARSRAAAAGPRPRRESPRALLVDESPDDAELIVAELRRRFELDALQVETRLSGRKRRHAYLFSGEVGGL
jgi:hypothetical protein